MNYVALEHAYGNNMKPSVFEPEYKKQKKTYEDIVTANNDINPGDFYNTHGCRQMMKHIKICIHCREKLKKIIALQMGQEDDHYDEKVALREPNPMYYKNKQNVVKNMNKPMPYLSNKFFTSSSGNDTIFGMPIKMLVCIFIIILIVFLIISIIQEWTNSKSNNFLLKQLYQ